MVMFKIKKIIIGDEDVMEDQIYVLPEELIYLSRNETCFPSAFYKWPISELPSQEDLKWHAKSTNRGSTKKQWW